VGGRARRRRQNTDTGGGGRLEDTRGLARGDENALERQRQSRSHSGRSVCGPADRTAAREGRESSSGLPRAGRRDSLQPPCTSRSSTMRSVQDALTGEIFEEY